jgi:pyruvate/2-oxoglutarate dehydrogenase complex dihydrolipoamide acyltransferase (E2) component
MANDFKLPDVGEGISQAELLEWRVAVGDDVAEDQIVAFVSTDKVNVELPSPRAGTVEELCWNEGDIVPVGSVLIRFQAEGLTSELTAVEAPKRSEDHEKAAVDASHDRRVEVQTTTSLGLNAPAAPSTRRYAAERGIELATIAGSGPGGRILRSDVDRAATRSASIAPSVGPRSAESTFEPLRGVRSVVARRMAASSQQAATSTSTFEIHADEIVRLLEAFQRSPRQDAVKLTPLAVVAKCTAVALTMHPRFNATVADDASGLHLHRGVHLGVAVAAKEGLTVPVIRDADRMTVVELAASIREIAGRARTGSLAVAELQGGTFTISSTGGLEQTRIVSTTPIINLPQTAILWVSRIEDRPRVRQGVLGAGPMMTASVSFDHRFIDGAEVTEFINCLGAFLEQPLGALA